jgi:hypothetical protein
MPARADEGAEAAQAVSGANVLPQRCWSDVRAAARSAKSGEPSPAARCRPMPGEGRARRPRERMALDATFFAAWDMRRPKHNILRGSGGGNAPGYQRVPRFLRQRTPGTIFNRSAGLACRVPRLRGPEPRERSWYDGRDGLRMQRSQRARDGQTNAFRPAPAGGAVRHRDVSVSAQAKRFQTVGKSGA